MDVSSKKKILFLCTGNSARSQMAEGLIRHFRGEEFESFSAGIDLKGVHPKALEVMNSDMYSVYAPQSMTRRLSRKVKVMRKSKQEINV